MSLITHLGSRNIDIQYVGTVDKTELIKVRRSPIDRYNEFQEDKCPLTLAIKPSQSYFRNRLPVLGMPR